ncbi:dTDP-glucose 4,6-dehydratase [Pandoraea morbifera]|uniref:dTDP-glucose 4,6-dehydratase n=1 Tax=Pandoraea morbifera TaxID=2508300 RepID=A0A5E4YFY9_9BURK|nr:NAD-dependent epimerase/dehydratase family protein [Pandoraea morbifera]VVE47634.1 dTDP-glucose 4,6-dehydratase [Pandoraea morbifera]
MNRNSATSRVLLTGARGFTGHHVRKALEAAGYAVYGLSQESDGDANGIAADISDLSALTRVFADVRPDYVVHLAAIAFVGHADIRQFYDVNLFGTLNLFEAANRAGVTPTRFLIASSANVYGNPPMSAVSEAVCPAPVNHYAMSKLSMEHMVRTWSDRFNVTIVRPFNYTGVGQSEQFLIPKLVAHFRDRKPEISLGNLDVSREFNDVRMVARAYADLLHPGVQADGMTVNLCSGKGYALGDVVAMLEGLCGHKISITTDPRLVRANELKALVGVPDRLRALLPDLPQFDLVDTLRWMLDYPASTDHA